jgi:hypothetical protein
MTDLTFFRPVDIKTKKSAEAICGSLSKPSKMPCHSYSTPAQACKVGSVLRKVPGSVCSKCYAMKGMYPLPNVQKAMSFRLGNLYHPQWVEAIVFLIRKAGQGFFRWHDSGDLQSLAHLINIVRVAEELPHVKFWLPTREKSIVAQYERSVGTLPDNLIVRLSAAMVGGDPPPGAAYSSTVHLQGAEPEGQWLCPAHTQGNKCGECRACWSKDVAVVSYLEH